MLDLPHNLTVTLSALLMCVCVKWYECMHVFTPLQIFVYFCTLVLNHVLVVEVAKMGKMAFFLNYFIF